LQVWPLHGAYCRLVVGNAVSELLGPPPAPPDANVTLLAAEIAKMMAPLLRS